MFFHINYTCRPEWSFSGTGHAVRIWLLCLLGGGFFFFPAAAQDRNADYEVRMAMWRSWLAEDCGQEVLDSCKALLETLPPGRPADPVRASAYALYGSALRRENRYREALEWQRRALRLRLEVLPPDHEQVASSYLNVGNGLLLLDSAGAALRVLHRAEAIKLRKFGAGSPQLLRVYTSLGGGYRAERRFQEATRYFRAVADIVENTEGENSPSLIGPLNDWASLLNESKQFDAAGVLLQRAFRLLPGSLYDNGVEAIRLFNCLGVSAAGGGRYTEALVWFDRALTLCERQAMPENALRGECLVNAGNCRLDLGDFALAEINFRAALPCFPARSSEQAAVLNGLGLALRYRGDPEQVQVLFETAHRYYLQAGPTAANCHAAAGAFQNLGGYFFDCGAWRAALFFFGNALQRFRGLAGTESEQAAVLDKTARCKMEQGDWRGAQGDLQTGLRIAPAQNRALRFALIFQQGEWCLRQDRSFEAQVLFEKAADALGTGKTPGVQTFPYETLLVKTAMADVHRRLAIQSGTPVSWRRALNAAQSVVEDLRLLQADLQGDAAAGELQQIFDAPFDVAVEACLALGRPEEAWQWSERFKGVFFQKLSWQAMHHAAIGLPEVEQTRERALAARLARFRRLALETPEGSVQAGIFADSIRILSEARHRLRLQWMQRFPDYARWIAEIPVAALPAVQAQLQPDQTLLSYHFCRRQVVVFRVDRQGFDARILPVQADSLTADAARFAHLCRLDPQELAGLPKSDLYRETVELGARLYGQLIGPVASALKTELFIAPDAVLCMLPFEALISHPGVNAHRFSEHGYLIQTHDIGYIQSASSQLAMSNRAASKAEKTVLAIAPDFSNNDAGLRKLAYNKAEVDAVRQIVGGDSWKDTAAEKTRFTHWAGRYRILLLATHGVMDDRNPAASFVAFTGNADSARQSLLYAAEIYGLRLDADLVVLSACQTASGKLLRGEGIQSIAQAFQFAGARSLVASKWNVDDQRAPDIMRVFFQQLQAGHAKATALAMARRGYLADHKGADAHPYFWAGFAVLGDPVPVRFLKTPDRFLYALSLTGIFLLFLGVVWRRLHYRK